MSGGELNEVGSTTTLETASEELAIVRQSLLNRGTHPVIGFCQ